MFHFPTPFYIFVSHSPSFPFSPCTYIAPSTNINNLPLKRGCSIWGDEEENLRLGNGQMTSVVQGDNLRTKSPRQNGPMTALLVKNRLCRCFLQSHVWTQASPAQGGGSVKILPKQNPALSIDYLPETSSRLSLFSF